MVKLIYLIFFNISLLASINLTPSDVFLEALKIEKELNLIKNHYKIDRKIGKKSYPYTNIKPRNVWQMTHFILTKINILRSKHQLPIVTVNSIEPVQFLNPNLVYEQTQRILTELRIFKKRMGIKTIISSTKNVNGKEPIDVFHKFLSISNQLDLINGSEISPSYVFGEIMRIYEDVSYIIDALNLEDKTIPPKKISNITPRETFNYIFDLIEEIQKVQRVAKIDRVDFSVFKRDKDITPNKNFILITLALSELQPIKAYIGLKHKFTPSANYYENKIPADVAQVVTWVKERLKLINSF